MASPRRLWRAYKTCHVTSLLPKVSPISAASTKRDGSYLYHCMLSFYPHCLRDNLDANILHGHSTRLSSQYGRLSSAITAALTGLFGAGLVSVSYAAADEEAKKTPFMSDSSPTYTYLEGLARMERLRLEDLLKNKGMPQRVYPKFTVGVKGQKVTIKFHIPPTCEIPRLLARLVLHFGWMLDGSTNSDMLLRASDSAAAWQLSLTNPKTLNASGGDLHILMFQSVIPSTNTEIEFIKEGSFSQKELEAVASVLRLAGEKISRNNIIERKPRGETWEMPSGEKSISSLEALGVRVFGLVESQMSYSDQISWENIAGYDQQKRQIEDTILLALQSPEVYDDIARGTRNKFESNRPRAVLFEGPPGTGKTSCARVIANQAGVPLVYVPLEVVMSKYYGESERLLGKVFTLANDLPDGAIVFLDEVDSFAMTRDNDMHEATRRILSVLLRQIDGFEQDKKVIVIAATNRKQDLDPALMSRFDSVITFNIPDQQNREKIAAQYAKHLTESELVELAKATEGMSGRDIRDVCQQAERHWASKIIRDHTHIGKGEVPLPPLQEYMDSAKNREVGLRVDTQRDWGRFANKLHLDVS